MDSNEEGKEVYMGQKPKDITGKRYGMLTALCYSGKKHTDGG